jgi:micrococcal nuclease
MHQYRCIMIKIIDGDTVDVDIDLGFGVWLKKQRIRFYGLDTPESRTSDAEEKKYGFAAKEFVQSYLEVGTQQKLITIKDATGKFGRILGRFEVYNQETDSFMMLDEIMISKHHAVAYFGQSKDVIAESHLANRQFVEV